MYFSWINPLHLKYFQYRPKETLITIIEHYGDLKKYILTLSECAQNL